MFENIQNIITQQIPMNITGTSNSTIPAIPALTLENLFGDTISTLVAIALILGFFVRTNSEYLEKLFKGEIYHFDRKYAATAIIGIIVTLPIVLATVPEGIKIFAIYAGNWGIAGGLLAVGVLGYGLNHGTNKTTSLLGHFFTAKKTEEDAQINKKIVDTLKGENNKQEGEKDNQKPQSEQK